VSHASRADGFGLMQRNYVLGALGAQERHPWTFAEIFDQTKGPLIKAHRTLEVADVQINVIQPACFDH
jgi:hypothetical protein